MNAIQIIEPFELTEQQEEFVLSGYAAYEDDATIYIEFMEAFPETINDWVESFGEDNVEEPLRMSIKHLYPGHHKFPRKRLGLTFDVLRRQYLATQDDEKMGQSRNRQRMALKIYEQLEDHAKEHPDTFLQCKKLQLEVLEESREEHTAIQKVIEAKEPSVTVEEIKLMMKGLTQEQFDEFVVARDSGQHQNNLVQLLLEFNEQNKENESEEGGETIPEQLPQISGETEDQEQTGSADEVQDEHGTEIYFPGDAEVSEEQQRNTTEPAEG